MGVFSDGSDIFLLRDNRRSLVGRNRNRGGGTAGAGRGLSELRGRLLRLLTAHLSAGHVLVVVQVDRFAGRCCRSRGSTTVFIPGTFPDPAAGGEVIVHERNPARQLEQLKRFFAQTYHPEWPPAQVDSFAKRKATDT